MRARTVLILLPLVLLVLAHDLAMAAHAMSGIQAAAVTQSPNHKVHSYVISAPTPDHHRDSPCNDTECPDLMQCSTERVSPSGLGAFPKLSAALPIPPFGSSTDQGVMRTRGMDYRTATGRDILALSMLLRI